MPDSFDDRFSGLPVDAPSTPLISDIVGNAQIASPQFNLVPVDYDPFPKRRKGPAAFNDEPPSEMIRPDAPVADKMFGLNGKERYQFFPERLARSVYDIMSGQVAPYNPSTGEYNVEGAMDVAGLLGGAPLGIKPGAASLGSGAVRPIMNANKNEAVPAFFSAVEKAVTDISQPKMTGQQWLGTLSNKPGVKPEELDWIGLKDYLKENADKVVTKQEIESHVAANKVELKDVDKGKTFDYPYKTHDEWESAIIKAERKNDWDEVNRLNLAWEQSEGQGHGGPKYAKWQLPGGENYREKLLTLPNKLKAIGEDQAKQIYTDVYQVGGKSWEELSSFERNDWIKAFGNQEAPPSYKSSHWEEPNVLAHIRMNDRFMPDETGPSVKPGYNAFQLAGEHKSTTIRKPDEKGYKSLHIEEIQSDWHQQGRQQGYKDNNPTYKETTVENASPEIKKALQENKFNLDKIKNEKLYDYGNGKYSLREPANEQTISDWNSNALPDAPFKKTWHELALKRMLREAAEKGYDRLSWTPGEAQAARYDLSKQVDGIIAEKKKSGNFDVAYKPKGSGRYERLGDELTPAKLAENVGKELAEKIIKQEKATTEYSGLELKIGGEGMKGFYDQIIPKALEKIGKEHGVKVKQGEIPPELPNYEIRPAAAGHIGTSEQRTVYDVYDNKNKLMSSFHTRDQANSYIVGRKVLDKEKTKQPIHYIDIPQSLKDQAMHKGFPLFSGGFMLNPIDHNPFEEKK